jgi:hypothetical protein
MLFITPPKLHEFKSPSPSPSPILDIMQSLNDLLSDEEERKKFLHPELIKLLDGTPIQNPIPVKQFVAKKWSRNISNLFSEDKQPKVSITQKYSQPNSGQLNAVESIKPFYPQNYNWSQNAVYDYKVSKHTRNAPTLPVNHANSLLGLPGKMCQEMSANAPKSAFKTLKLNSGNSWKKYKFEKSQKGGKKMPKRAASNNSNKENKCVSKCPHVVEDQSKQAALAFSFPDGGWVCSFCQNYNFYGRVKCNRCSKAKNKDDWEGKPQHIIRKELKARKKNDENNMNNMNKMKLKKHIQLIKVQQIEVPPSEAQTSEGNNMLNAEKVGDWVCFSWSNLNFSFRKIWNRCEISREESDMNYATSTPIQTAYDYANFQNNGMANVMPLMGYSFPSVMPSAHHPMNPSQAYSNNMQPN